MLSFVLMNKLGPVKLAMLQKGQVRQVILMSPNLSAFEKAILLREFNRR